MLVVENIVAGYVEDVDILHSVSLEVRKGQISSIIGPNGSGKSTLVRVICGMLPARQGEVRYDATKLSGTPAHRMAELGIAYLPQERTVFPHLTVEQNIELGGWTFRRDGARIGKMLRKVYAQFPILAERKNTKGGDLSGGQQKILEIARALMIEPNLLVFDEPTVGLAPIVAKEVYDTLERLKAEGMTVLLVDQNVREAVRIGDHVYVLELGRNKADGARDAFEGDLHALIKDWLQI
ncbi:MAG: ABC transporter ATP-binding protein [Thalassobaculaceae bacterium]|nr:ABC transporter ATP-binding protein [Thalassobaculaceae bacterium]